MELVFFIREKKNFKILNYKKKQKTKNIIPRNYKILKLQEK